MHGSRPVCLFCLSVRLFVFVSRAHLLLEHAADLLGEVYELVQVADVLRGLQHSRVVHQCPVFRSPAAQNRNVRAQKHDRTREGERRKTQCTNNDITCVVMTKRKCAIHAGKTNTEGLHLMQGNFDSVTTPLLHLALLYNFVQNIDTTPTSQSPIIVYSIP